MYGHTDIEMADIQGMDIRDGFEHLIEDGFGRFVPEHEHEHEHHNGEWRMENVYTWPYHSGMLSFPLVIWICAR